MKYTMQMFWEGEMGAPVAPFLLPLTLVFPSIDGMREVVKKLSEHAEIPVHSFTITSEGGDSERWFFVGGEWRRKDAKAPNAP